MSGANPVERMLPAILRLLRMMYRSVRRDWRLIPHLGAVLLGFGGTYLRLRFARWRAHDRFGLHLAVQSTAGAAIYGAPVLALWLLEGGRSGMRRDGGGGNNTTVVCPATPPAA